MIKTLPNIDTYPKIVMLQDDSLITLRPLNCDDKVALMDFFKRIPEEERHYLKEAVTSPQVILEWTANVNHNRVVPIVAVAGGGIVADATLHLSRSPARRHVAEIRIVVDPAYREVGLGRRMIREIMDIGADMGLQLATFELVAGREAAAINAARGVGFKEVVTLRDWIKDFWGNYQDLVILDRSLTDRDLWWF